MMKVIIVLLTFFFSLNSWSSQKLISLSFDDAPRGDSIKFTGVERTRLIVENLKKSKVDQVIFNVNPGRIDSDIKLARIKKYHNAGHLIGNHTWGHPKAAKVGAKKFIADFKKAHDYLEEHNLLSPYFRYPFLNRGKDLSEINAINEVIMNKFGYQDGYVTIDNWDWYMNSLFHDALKAGLNINYESLKKYYVSTLMESVRFYNQLSVKSVGKELPQVLLLHENDLAALFLNDLVVALRREGWTIISAEDSYTKNEYSVFPKTVLEHGQGRAVSYAISQGYRGELRSGLEDFDSLRKRFQESNITSK